MQRILLLLIVCMLTGCTVYHAYPVPGETRKDQKGKIISANEAFIRTKVSAKYKAKLNCPINKKNYKVLDTKVTRDLTQKEKEKAHIADEVPAWYEDWIIEACGTKWRVPILFSGNIISTSGAYPIK
jgi:hypothetical protein